LSFSGSGARVVEPARFGSPLYDAGVERGDVLISLDGRSLSSARRLGAVLAELDAGQRVPLVYSRRGEWLTARVTVRADPTLELLPGEQAGREPTPAQQRFRDEWLRSKR
jgi:S1-C subfamily serine protease